MPPVLRSKWVMGGGALSTLTPAPKTFQRMMPARLDARPETSAPL
jgi:hypothetical protein